MGIVIIKNRQDAQDYLINQFAPTDSDNRASNALLGAALGGLGGGLLGTAVKKNGLGAGIGALAGAGLGGYLAYKKMSIPSAERNRNVGIAGIKGTGVVYVVGSHKGGQPFVETVADIRQAEELAKQLGKTGAKAFVVTPQELAMNPEYAHLYRSPAQALTNRFDDKNIFVAKYLRDNPLANRAEAEAAYKLSLQGETLEDRTTYVRNFSTERDPLAPKYGWADYDNKITTKAINKHLEANKGKESSVSVDSMSRAGGEALIKSYKTGGTFGGGILGGVAGGGLGYLAGKGIAGLKNKDTYIKEYLSKHPGANQAEAEASYKKRASNFKKAGAGLGAVAGALGGGYLGRKNGQNMGKMKALHLMRNMKKGTFNIS